MIPKKIHYFWFGKGEKSALEKECISRFSVFAPGFEIKEWTEENFNVMQHPYSREAYKNRKWAFVSDYARLKVLYDEGGIYLDTDMWLARDITKLCDGAAFIGKEDDTYISAGIIGAGPTNYFIKDALEYYDKINDFVTIPRVLTEVYNSKKYDIKVFEPDVFYPYSAQNIKIFDKKNPPASAYAVHMWNYSWGHPAVKFFKKIGLHRKIVYISESLKIKKLLKNILGIK